ncbi:MAG TPA: AAA family ATPase [Savagea sp.]
MNKYSQALINSASKLDAVTEGHGEITKLAAAIIEEQSKTATVALLTVISKTINDPMYKTPVLQVARLVHRSLVDFYGHVTIQDICQITEEEEDPRTLEELLEELNALVGLETVKTAVQDLIVYQKVQMLRKENDLHSSKNTLHLAFTGNPGTGKTTVARIVGRIYKQIGLLSKGHFIEVSRTDLIAGYQGQTAIKVRKVIERAKGGVLFIDEAYSITENDHSDSYGREGLTELTKALEDYREDLVVIVAGYTKPMDKFFESNPGLKSRFNTFIEFDDYNAKELGEILQSICEQNDYTLDETMKEKVDVYFQQHIEKKDESFANGRLARNLYDDLVMNHARRMIKLSNPTKEELSTIIAEDFIFDLMENDELIQEP